MADDHVEHYVRCECFSPDHMFMVSVWLDPDCPQCFLEVQLTRKGGFWYRLWHRVKYLFLEHKSRYGSWDEVCVSKDDAVKIRDAMQEFIEAREKYEQKFKKA